MRGFFCESLSISSVEAWRISVSHLSGHRRSKLTHSASLQWSLLLILVFGGMSHDDADGAVYRVVQNGWRKENNTV